MCTALLVGPRAFVCQQVATQLLVLLNDTLLKASKRISDFQLRVSICMRFIMDEPSQCYINTFLQTFLQGEYLPSRHLARAAFMTQC